MHIMPPLYGIPCNIATCCDKCKEEGMIKKPRSRCIDEDCKEIAMYGSDKPIHCEEHKDDNDINLFFCSQCNNKYHKNCIFEIVKFNRSQGKTSKCPICREEIYFFAMIFV